MIGTLPSKLFITSRNLFGSMPVKWASLVKSTEHSNNPASASTNESFI
jgi:hypothetical protein